MAAIQGGQTAAHAYEVESQLKEGPTEPRLLALNELFQEVSERNRQLRELNRSLETKVEVGTQDL